MADYQITCVRKATNTHEGITHAGGPVMGTMTRAEVVHAIDAVGHTFFTFVDNRRANVATVGTPPNKYIRTHADGKWSDNLLALPRCP